MTLGACGGKIPTTNAPKRITLTGRGTAIIPVIRDAVGELEREWEAALGRKPFAQLSNLLHDLNQVI